MSFPKPHLYPSTVLRSKSYRAKVNGIPLDVLDHPAADHTSFECTGPVLIEVEVSAAPQEVQIRPLSFAIKPEIKGNLVCFTLTGPQNVQIEIEGQPLLYVYALHVASAAPSGPHVRRFEAGKIHDAGLISLRAGEVCWIEPGAIVRGNIQAVYADKVQIGGYGILDGSYWIQHGNSRRRGIILDHCKQSRVEDILMLGPVHWMISLGACENISVIGVRQIAHDVSSDGIDIAGSRHIRISRCCLHNGDDNIAIKAINNKTGEDEKVPAALRGEDWKGTVEDVIVSDCTFYNVLGGSAMEIGYETSTDHIRNIRFENIDVMGVHQFGSVFGIHNGDRACVENIVWDDIRVDHHYDKLVDFRVLNSRWNIDKERGSIRNITLRNINVAQSLFNEGYTMSIICGYDAEHPVTSVVFDQFKLGGRLVANADELYLATRHAHAISFVTEEVDAIPVATESTPLNGFIANGQRSLVHEPSLAEQ